MVLPRVIVTDPLSVCLQTLKDHLALVRGEYFLDQSVGTPWLQILGVKILNDAQAVAMITSVISAVSGIVNTVVQVKLDRVNRSFSYSYQCTFNSGAIITGGNGQPPTVQGGS
jgi:hypothetical protein